MILYAVQEQKTKNGSYKISVMTLTSTKTFQQFGYAVEKTEMSTAFALTRRHPFHSTARITCVHTRAQTHAYTQRNRLTVRKTFPGCTALQLSYLLVLIQLS